MRTPTPLAELVDEEARAEMAKQKQTIGALAEHLQVSYRTANRLILGYTAIDLDQLANIGQFLSVDPLELASRSQRSAA
jgi:plasmid maintenance system antidote protein VapI